MHDDNLCWCLYWFQWGKKSYFPHLECESSEYQYFVCLIFWSSAVICTSMRKRVVLHISFCLAVKFEDTIPTDAPPSFRGQAVKYSYKVIIGTQRLGTTTKLLRIPFRVMVMPGEPDTVQFNSSCYVCYTKIWNRVDCQRFEKWSKIHKRLKERFLIGQNYRNDYVFGKWWN